MVDILKKEHKENMTGIVGKFTFQDVCNAINDCPTAREREARFKRLCAAWLKADPYYSSIVEKVWLWEDFASQLKKDIHPCILSNRDMGIDIVVRALDGEYWAVHCKLYDKKTVIDRSMINSFVAETGKRFVLIDGEHTFSRGFWIYNDGYFRPKATKIMEGQSIPFVRIHGWQMAQSEVDWYSLAYGTPVHREPKELFEHQKKALAAAHAHFAEHVRGKLIMACGTGKTFTSLKIVEQELTGKKGALILFLVPSIALLGQTLNAWMADCNPSKIMKAICVCSDTKASRKFRKEDDAIQEGVMDLALPASTDADGVFLQLEKFKDIADLVVVFSTYQSLDVVHEVQQLAMERMAGWGVFDFVICDEAHRTTGAKGKSQEESSFARIHDDGFIKATKRLYMTATPRMYGDEAKRKAKEMESLVWSMDDEDVYGKEFFRVNFSYAVQHGLLTDYKVLILTVPASTRGMPQELVARVEDSESKELNVDLASQLMGAISALSKHIPGDRATWAADPCLMRRGLVFCGRIGKDDQPGSSKNVAFTFAGISEQFAGMLPEVDKENIVHVQARHVDGSMGADERNDALAWLKEEPEDPQECRLLCNVRCLSEGIDIPALDAVIYLAPRRSKIDVVQSVGRIMRNFRKGQDGEKKFGYVILPVVVPFGISPKDALNDNECFDAVWDVLKALRAHDDGFNANVNQIALNEKRSDKIVVGEWLSNGHWWWDGEGSEDKGCLRLTDALLAESSVRDLIYSKIVEKVGDRTYWDRWSQSVGNVAQKLIGRIGDILKEPGKHRVVFEAFLGALRENLNPSVTEGQAVEMLAQYLVTGSVFNALFQDYDFDENNPVSSSMRVVVQMLEKRGLLKDTEILSRFYESVRTNIGQIDNAPSKQDVIRNLYEKFFKGAFPKTVEQLGIVYTPVELVDFILRSTEAIMQKEFGRSLSDEGVHILDPFAGTGTFIVRLLQSGIVKDKDLLRKYQSEIHANEIVLLAYYVSGVNIETVFNGIWKTKHPDSRYERYYGIALTDTFEQYERNVHAWEGRNLHSVEAFTLGENTEQTERQQKAPIRVIVGNPPYSVGQKAANDNAQNQSYPKLNQRISDTYAAATKATLKSALYDTYIKAFRWASDCISEDEGGIIAFVTNAGWLDGNAMDGMRMCLEQEFSSIYVVNLRGDQRTSGDLSKKEGGKIFGSGSRTPVAVTILVKKPGHKGRGSVHYYAVEDYLSREAKLKLLRETPNVFSLSLENMHPDERGGWLYQRNSVFNGYVDIGDKKNRENRSTVFCQNFSSGVKTNRDAWCYSSGVAALEINMKKTIGFYNQEVEKIDSLRKDRGDLSAENLLSFLTYDSTLLSWDARQKEDVVCSRKYSFRKDRIFTCMYRPFFKQHGYIAKEMNNRVYLIPSLFPTPAHSNKIICISGIGVKKPFSCLIIDKVPDLEMIGKSQCFPLIWYEEESTEAGKKAGRLPGMEQAPKFTRRDGVTNWALEYCRILYPGQDVTKEDIFYYVYGILHSQEYRATFGEDLKKSLPHVPFPDAFNVFVAFSRAGRELAEIHLHYEEQSPWPDVVIEGDGGGPVEVEKARWRSLGRGQVDKTVLHLNSSIILRNIPARAHEYVVNGKSALDWLVERYAVTVDKTSGIRNDPNDWGKEHGNPRYILALFLSVITVSMKTLEIVDGLPKLAFGKDGLVTVKE